MLSSTWALSVVANFFFMTSAAQHTIQPSHLGVAGSFIRQKRAFLTLLSRQMVYGPPMCRGEVTD